MAFMNRKEFNDKLKKLGFTKKEFAELIEYSYSGARRWKILPKWVVIVLDHIELLNSISSENKVKKDLLDLTEEVHKMALMSEKRIYNQK